MTYRILSVAPTSFFADYGCHVRILEEARALGRLGHEVTVCTYHTGRDPAGVRVVRMPRVPWHAEVRVGSHLHKLYFDALLAARCLVASIGRVDVVHGHLHEGALIGYFVSRLRGVPLVFDYQGSLTREMIDHQFLREGGPLHRPLAWLERAIERLPDVVVASSANAARAVAAQRTNGPPIFTLQDGIDAPALRAPAPADVRALRERLQVPLGVDVVGYIGLLAEYQGVGQLIYAARRIVERRPHTHFLVMGYPGLERYRRQAYDLQILDKVTFTGRVPYEQAPLHLALADVAVSPKLSVSEANGKLLLYMATGLPTVAYDTPVAREILGELGVYAPVGDVARLADALEGLLDDGARRASLGARLQDRVRREFSWDAAAGRLAAIYGAARERRATGRGRAWRPVS